VSRSENWRFVDPTLGWTFRSVLSRDRATEQSVLVRYADGSQNRLMMGLGRNLPWAQGR
jgi:hypothetical protein